MKMKVQALPRTPSFYFDCREGTARVHSSQTSSTQRTMSHFDATLPQVAGMQTGAGLSSPHAILLPLYKYLACS
jgi:hypothetical protein